MWTINKAGAPPLSLCNIPEYTHFKMVLRDVIKWYKKKKKKSSSAFLAWLKKNDTSNLSLMIQITRWTAGARVCQLTPPGGMVTAHPPWDTGCLLNFCFGSEMGHKLAHRSSGGVESQCCYTSSTHASCVNTGLETLLGYELYSTRWQQSFTWTQLH